jgi:predicted CXXCH cytochrome family protein
MEGLTYEGRPLGHEQFDHWKKSVHGVALLVKGDLSAPTCNDCHGNHGALPPQVDSVANACGTCHGKVADLFAATRMKHRFQEAKLPGCATCHTSHEIQKPTDEMLGMEAGSVCVDCHTKNQYGATLAGAEAAKAMRSGLEMLKSGMAEAEAKIDQAEQKGMEVRGPRFDLRQARDALVSARTQVHSFSRPAFEKSLEQGVAVIEAVKAKAEDALNEHTRRRIWLAISLVPILITVGLLWAYIRVLPLPEASSKATSHH